jgi:hypothetical protein
MGMTRRELLQIGAAAALGATLGPGRGGSLQTGDEIAELILHNARIATVDAKDSLAQAVAIAGGRFVAVGSDAEVLRRRAPETRVLDLARRTVVPGLDDSHLHLIRGGLNYNLELRWDGVGSLAEALERLRLQARSTPPPQWVRVVGGWSEFQFRERRLPTLAELNEAAPETPVFVLHLYDRALLNRAALRALGFEKEVPAFDRSYVERDERGRPTGLLVAKPSPLILYSTLGLAPKLSEEQQANSTRHFMRELNRLGVTSCIDAGGGFQNYPADYGVIRELHREGQLTVRIGYHLFAQKPGSEAADYGRWVGMTRPGDGDAWLRTVGAGENLTWSAADFENFREPRPDLPASMEGELEGVVRVLAKQRWPFRIHATYDESIQRFLSVFERVDGDLPLAELRWFIDHAETISDRSLERVRALGGGVAVQHRMAFQGDYFLQRYGADAARLSPPLRRMLELGVPVGGGTDATRVASHNPWVSLGWLVSGRTLAGTPLYDDSNRLERPEALRVWTLGSSWFSGEEESKGSIAPGKHADLAVLSKDFFSVPEDEIRSIESVLTVVGGRIVHGQGDFAPLAPPLPPAAPDWSPVRRFAGVAPQALARPPGAHGCACFVV